jgi:hypothetical protein
MMEQAISLEAKANMAILYLKVKMLQKQLNDDSYSSFISIEKDERGKKFSNIIMIVFFADLFLMPITLLFMDSIGIAPFLISLSILVLYPFIEKLDDLYYKINPRALLKLTEEQDEELERANLEQPEIFAAVSQAFEKCNEQFRDKSFYEQYILAVTINLVGIQNTTLRIEIEDIISTILTGKFVLESLNLPRIIYDEKFGQKIQATITNFHDLLLAIKNNEKSLSFMQKISNESMKEIKSFQTIITLLKESLQEKSLKNYFEKQIENIKEQLQAGALSKGNITVSKAKGPDITKEDILAIVAALDPDIVEIRTRAGTFYSIIGEIKNDVDEDLRDLELLTDRELAIKNEVIDGLLEELEQEKQELSDEDYQRIRSNYLTQQFSINKILERRNSGGKMIDCPYCQQEISSIARKCPHCKNKLPICMICLNVIGHNTKVKSCPHCLSVAHIAHFDNWLQKSNHCPYCKKELNKEIDIQLINQILVKE